MKLTRLVTLITVSALLLLGIGCSSSHAPTKSLLANKNMQASGTITLARPLPGVTTVLPTTMLGFLPTNEPKGRWLNIDRESSEVRLMEGPKSVFVAEASEIENLEPGRFSVLHKQRDPLWYAPESYFTERGLPVPEDGDSSRYLRGALGSFALFLDASTSLHSSPFPADEVTGVQLQESELAKVYYSLNVGDVVIVK